MWRRGCDSHFSKKLGLQLNFQWMLLEEPWNIFESGLRRERGRVDSEWIAKLGMEDDSDESLVR